MDTVYQLIMHLRLVEQEYRFLKKQQQSFDINDYPGLIRKAHTLLDHRGQWRIPAIERVEKAGFLMCRGDASTLIVLIDGDPIGIPLTTTVYRSQPPLSLSLKQPLWWVSLITPTQ
jgi:hypothetical protein